MRRFTFDIDVEPHVHKYITYHLNQEPVIVKDSHWLGILIINCLKRAPFNHRNKIQHKKLPIHITEKYFELPKLDLRKQAICMPADRAKVLNASVDEIMREEMYTYVSAHLKAIGRVNQTVKEFLDNPDLRGGIARKKFSQLYRHDIIQSAIYEWKEKYGITEEDKSFESLKKWFYRTREVRKKLINRRLEK